MTLLGVGPWTRKGEMFTTSQEWEYPYVLTGFVSQHTAATADAGTAPGSNTPVFIDSWYDDSGAGCAGHLTGFLETEASGWSGGGIPFDPYCLVFAGDEYVAYSSYAAFNFGESSFAVEAWFAATDTGVGQGYMVTKGAGSGVQGFRFGYGTNGKPRITMGGAANYVEGDISTSVTVNDGLWHHMVVNFVRGGTATCYVDGVQVGGLDISGATGSMDSDALPMIGSAAAHFKGKIGAVRIYSAPLDEIHIRYNYCAGMAPGNLYGHGVLAESSVINDDGLWKMWYTGFNGIGYATAPDALGPWTKYAGNPVVADGSESNVVKVDDVYHMFQICWGADYQTKIFHKTSADGIAWSAPVVALAKPGWCTELDNPVPWLGLDGRTWHLFYATIDGGPGLATSLSIAGPWTHYGTGPIFTDPSDKGYAPHVVTIEGVAYMWFHYDAGLGDDIAQAHSLDGVSWIVDAMPLLSRTGLDEGEGLSTSQIADAQFVRDNNRYVLYYTANRHFSYWLQPAGAQWKIKAAIMPVAAGADVSDRSISFASVPGIADLSCVAGDEIDYRMTLSGYDLTGTTASFRVAAAAGNAHLFERTTNAGISYPDAVNGQISVTLATANTSALAGFYHWQLRITDVSGAETVAARGRFWVHRAVT